LEIEKYSQKSGALLAVYINMFLKLKQEPSGYSACLQTEDKYRYIEKYDQAEEIVIYEALIAKNPGQETLAKLKLGSEHKQNSNDSS
jgi:hypothetical protein